MWWSEHGRGLGCRAQGVEGAADWDVGVWLLVCVRLDDHESWTLESALVEMADHGVAYTAAKAP